MASACYGDYQATESVFGLFLHGFLLGLIETGGSGRNLLSAHDPTGSVHDVLPSGRP